MTSGCVEESWLASVSLEPMREEDLAAVLEIDHLSFPSSWSPDSYLRDLRNRNSHYVVARLAGEIIGYAGMWIMADEAHISTLAVHPSRRRAGLGKRLLSHLLAAARERGASEVTLEVREANAAARSLYESFGFQATGMIAHYYGDTGESAVVMARSIAPADAPEEMSQ